MQNWSRNEKFWLFVLVAASVISALWTLFLASQANWIWEELHFLMAGRNPDWGYPDTPAGTPLWVAGSETLFGPSRLAVRSATWFVSSLLPFAVWFMASPVVSRKHALMAGGLAAILPPFVTGAVYAYPEGPQQVLTALFLGCLVRALQKNKLTDWVMTGLVCAVGVFFYYRFLFVPGAAFVFAIATASGRKHLLNPLAWFGGGIALLGLVPSLIDNLNKDFGPLLYHAGRRQDWTFFPEALTYPLQQAGLVTPIAFILLLLGAVHVMSRWRTEKTAETALFSVAVLFLFLPFMILALFDSNSLPHWPFLAYVAVLPFVPEAVAKLSNRVAKGWQSLALKTGVILGLGLAIGTTLLFGVNILLWRHSETWLTENQMGLLRGGDLEDWSILEDDVRAALQAAGPDAVFVGGDHITTLRIQKLLPEDQPAYTTQSPIDTPRDYQGYRRRLGQGEADLLGEHEGEPAIIVLSEPAYLYREADEFGFREHLCGILSNSERISTTSLTPGEVQVSIFRADVGAYGGDLDPADCAFLPSVVIEQPRAGKYVSGEEPVFGIAADPAGVKAVTIFIDGAPVPVQQTRVDLPGYRFPELLSFDPDYPSIYWTRLVDFSQFEKGRHTLEVEVETMSGEKRRYGERLIYIR
ncbi:MAG: hypothetical protein CMK09_04140 [Ponticaulis sp.]|nr:hypothetical protein [Ponticaulis sp.]|tara:strand:- start:26525 stop:28444 length:1920 start_codon:yes stop_codon:yes gene_type:complete